MSENKAANVAIKLVDLLTPLESEDRYRAIDAALTLLGETNLKNQKNRTDDNSNEPNEKSSGNIHDRANIWMKQNGLNLDLLETVFHFQQNDIELIASDVPGNTAATKVKSVYTLCGIIRFLSTGVPTFEDDFAREICGKLGCYDHTNHSKRVKDFGNTIAGNKSKGWTLTAPGLKKAADLIKEITGKYEG